MEDDVINGRFINIKSHSPQPIDKRIDMTVASYHYDSRSSPGGDSLSFLF